MFDSETPTETEDVQVSVAPPMTVTNRDLPVQSNATIMSLEGGTTMVNGMDVPQPTENGGFTHTVASKAKISAANKGKTPWNKGRQRTPEERARIAAGVRAKNRERHLKKLADMGLTEEEYEAQKKEERRKREAERRARRTDKGGFRPSDETRKKISQVLKAKWAAGEVKRRKTDPSKVRRGFKHSEETRAKISEALRKRWAEDPEYRENMIQKSTAANTRVEIRERISQKLKAKWEDPEFRAAMMEKMEQRRASGGRDQSYRDKVSAAIKAKWQDPEYRDKVLAKIRARSEEIKRNRPPKPPRVRKVRKVKKVKKKKKKMKRGVLMVEPSVKGKPRRRRGVAKGTKRKKSPVKGSVDSPGVADGLPEHKKSAVVKVPAAKKPVKKKTAKKKKEPDGSINRLRDERRDLYDLLYGDEDDELDAASGISALLDDDDLDSFDPYGLEDF